MCTRCAGAPSASTATHQPDKPTTQQPPPIARRPPRTKLTIGRSDVADFPQLGLEGVPVKVDTGAYTSSIHCHHVVQHAATASRPARLTFELLDPEHPQFAGREMSTTDFERRSVKSSNGEAEERYVIRTRIRLFGRDFPLELTLTERGEMRFPVLLGRRLLKGRFVVDPALANLSLTQKQARGQG